MKEKGKINLVQAVNKNDTSQEAPRCLVGKAFLLAFLSQRTIAFFFTFTVKPTQQFNSHGLGTIRACDP